jgi:hypothetical protein
VIPQIQSLISAARRQGACAQALATLEAAESLDELEQEEQLFAWIMWACDHEIMPSALRGRYFRWYEVAHISVREKMRRETIQAVRLWVETGALS